MTDTEFESNCQEESGDFRPPKKKLKPNSLCETVAVKVEGKIYHLNRVQLALKSIYFEKLFFEDFAEKNCDVVEIRGLNSDTFSAIIDLINGKDLKSVMNADNYLALLMGLDYLQMEIDLDVVKCYFVEEYSKREFVRPLDVKVIELYQFTTVNQNYRYLEIKLLKYISAHLIEIIKYGEEFVLSLPFEQFLKIIQNKVVMWCEFFGESNVRAKRTLSQICSKWICHDVENRIQHFAAILNGANYGFNSNSFLISNEKFEPWLDEIKKDTSQERIENCFQKLLNYCGEANPEVGQLSHREKSVCENHIVNKIDESKIFRFLDESDVTVKAGAKTYKLHRCILEKASTYFSGPIPTSVENSEFVVDIDEKTFDLMVDFIYFEKIPKSGSNSKTEAMRMLKAAAILKSKLIKEEICIPRMYRVERQLNSKDIIELLNLAVGNNWQSESWVTRLLHSFIPSLPKSEICEDIFRIWQICEAAELAQLSFEFRQHVTSVIDKMNNYENLIKTFRVICEINDAGKYSYLYIVCLCKLIVAPRTDSSVESHFVSVSCDILEDLLASEYFVISDPQKIVDICSKWIVHDVENRYGLIPRIVFAINQNNSMDFDDFEINAPADLSNCSQQVVNDELWKLLNLNCLLSRDLGSEQTSWDIKSRPMFILPKYIDEDTLMPREVCVLDSEFNEIVSLNFLLDQYAVSRFSRRVPPKLPATLIGDSLFVACEIRCKFRVYAYNFSSKKLNVLGFGPRMMFCSVNTLLNCNNELLWCFEDGRVLRYSILLNRWLEVYFDSESTHYGPYSSDGKKLFRYISDIVVTFDFEQSSWTYFKDVPSYSRDCMFFMRPIPKCLINFHNDIAFLCTSIERKEISIVLLDSRTTYWKKISAPCENIDPISAKGAKLVAYGEGLLFVYKNCIHELHRDFPAEGWQWRLKKSGSGSEFLGINTIHSVHFTAP